MKLNMGCGHNKKPGYVNVDMSQDCAPDLVFNLEHTPWPWADDSVVEVVFTHCLEHLGHTPAAFLGLFKELYRVCRDGAVVRITVPHPRHDHFLGDPTHVRAITPAMLSLFDQRLNERWRRMGAANTPLGVRLGVDFAVAHVETILVEPYRTLTLSHVYSPRDIETLLRERNNIASEYQVRLNVRKPPSR